VKVRKYRIWLFVLGVDAIVAALFLHTGYSLNEYWPDIVGTFLGIFGAVSLEEAIRTYTSDKDLKQDLVRLLEEVLKISNEFAPGTHYLVFNPQWKSLCSTEFIDYIGNKSHRYFELLDKHVEHHNDLVKQSMIRALDMKESERLDDYIFELDGDAYEVCVIILDDLYPDLLCDLDLGYFEELHPNKTVEEIQTFIHTLWKKRNIRR
jgi:hypothetical protein